MKRTFVIATIATCLICIGISPLAFAQPSARIGTVVPYDAAPGPGPSIVETDANSNLQRRYALVTSPNPFRDLMAIEFKLPAWSFVTLTLDDTFGHNIGTMISENLAEGNHRIEFEAATLPVGNYTYTLTIDTTRIVGTMVKVDE